jgi:hypothetical protein
MTNHLQNLKARDTINNSIQYAKPNSYWLVSFNKSWGKYLDTPDSSKNEYYQLALTDNKFGLTYGWYEDASDWKTFNQFFVR